MNWADQHGVSYLAWGWEPLSSQEISDQGCRAYYLTRNSGATPAAPNGTALHDHLAALAAGAGTTTSPRLRRFEAKVKAGGNAVSFTLRASQSSTATLSGRTVNSFTTTTNTQHHRVSLGSIRFTLAAGTSKTVSLTLSPASRALLIRQRNLTVQITITLTNPGRPRAVSHHTLTLKLPARRRD